LSNAERNTILSIRQKQSDALNRLQRNYFGLKPSPYNWESTQSTLNELAPILSTPQVTSAKNGVKIAKIRERIKNADRFIKLIMH